MMRVLGSKPLKSAASILSVTVGHNASAVANAVRNAARSKGASAVFRVNS